MKNNSVFIIYSFRGNHMSYTRHTILVSILFFQNSLSNDSIDSNNVQQVHFDIKSLYAPEVPEEVRKKIMDEITQQQNPDSTKKDESFTEADIEEMEFVFKYSPQEAQSIINYLQDPNYFPGIKNYRAIFFVGEPGTGKSITAKAIAYKMIQEGWEYKIISSTSLLGEYRNQTSVRLENELEKIRTSNKPTILIIDELNQLLENSNSTHHDTDTVSKSLWSFLDKQKSNNNFCLIGTMNRINKIPQQVKSRVYFIEFDLMTDPKIKNNIIRRNLTNQKTKINPEVTDDFLDKELEKIFPYSGRELEKISDEILIKSKLSNIKSSIVNINKDSISQGIATYLRKKTKEEYDIKEETDEERQNRYHQETLKMHKEHFTHQQMTQIFLSYMNNPLLQIQTRIHGMEGLLLTMTDEQKLLWIDIMKNTDARKADEKKAADEKAKKWFWEK